MTTHDTERPILDNGEDRLAATIEERGLHLLVPDEIPFEPIGPRPGQQPARPQDESLSTGVMEKWLVKPELDDDRFPISIVKFPPHYSFPRHWHTDGEFIMILKGSANFAGQVIGPGAMAYNDARTVYGTETAGPDGVEFLMIRRAYAKTTIVP